MKSITTLTWLLIFFAANPSNVFAQDEIFDSSVPTSKKAMLLVDIAVSDALDDPLIGTIFSALDMGGFGPPISFDDYKTIDRLTVFVGNPDIRNGESQFVARVTVKDEADLPKLVKQVFPFDAEESIEDGWTIMDIDRRWPEIIRYKGKTFEFGTSLFTYSASRSIASKDLIAEFSNLDKTSLARVVFDAKVFNSFVESIMRRENLEADAVYQMFEWGNFVNDSSIAIYGASLLKDVSTISLTVDSKSETLAKLAFNAATGKGSSVLSKIVVLNDFLKFHLRLPAEVLKQKGSPIGEILESVVDGMAIKQVGDRSTVSLAKPKDLGKTIVKLLAGVRSSGKEIQDMNAMLQVGLALHNYHDVYRKFPFTHPDFKEDARGISDDLSWRVKILPYCEWQNEYDKMDLSKGWDAEENQFVVAAAKEQFVLSRGSIICGIIPARPANKMATIVDGTSNTIMLIENPNAAMTSWSKPFDLKIDDAVKLVKGLKKGEFLWVTMFDGSVLRMPSMIDSGATEEQIRHLMDPRDGNVVDYSILQDAQRRLLPELNRGRSRIRRVRERDAEEPRAAVEFEAESIEETKEEVELEVRPKIRKEAIKRE